MTTHIRSDCPDGLLEVGGASFPIDAAGRIGELGETALADWMKAPTGSILARLGGQTSPLPIGRSEQCFWRRERAHDPSCSAGLAAISMATTTILVPAGTLAANLR